MRNLEKPLAAVKGRWMTGLTGADAAPEPWHALIGDTPDAELRLLALVAQAGEIGWRPAVPSLNIKPPLPTLDLPTMPEAARIRLRRVLDHQKPSAEDIAPILSLIEARGYSVHPGDWMPTANSPHTPDLYAPWVDWLSIGEGQASANVELSAETWDDFQPRERRVVLTSITKADRSRALSILAERAADAPAEERLGLIAVLGEGLCDVDIPYLESLGKDRSGKVKALAAHFLARLGAGQTDPDLVAELAEMVEVRTDEGFKNLRSKKAEK